MTTLVLACLMMAGLGASSAHQSPAPLQLDIRVFDGPTEVTTDTMVAVFDAGRRGDPRRVPQVANGERQVALPPGQYDLQLVHQDEGRVLGVRWTTLRLLAAYPGEHGRHLEVINLRPGFGALQVRRAGATAEQGRVAWTATLQRAGTREPVGTALPGDGYLVFVAPPGRYDIEVRTATGVTHMVRDAEVREDLTYLKTWS